MEFNSSFACFLKRTSSYRTLYTKARIAFTMELSNQRKGGCEENEVKGKEECQMRAGLNESPLTFLTIFICVSEKSILP